MPVWQIGLALMAAADGRESFSARSYGEFEFWFASIKVAAIVVFIVIAGAWLLGLDVADAGASRTSPRTTASRRSAGVASSRGVTTVIFSMCGAEIVTRGRGRIHEPNAHDVAAREQLVLRILLFYVLSILLIVASCRGPSSSAGVSPFALALERIGVPGAATIMNVIVLTAVLSCLNSGVYVTSRVCSCSRRTATRRNRCCTQPHAACRARAILIGSSFGYRRCRFGDGAGGAVCVPRERVGRDHADGLLHGVLRADPAAPAHRARRPERLTIRVWLFPGRAGLRSPLSSACSSRWRSRPRSRASSMRACLRLPSSRSRTAPCYCGGAAARGPE